VPKSSPSRQSAPPPAQPAHPLAASLAAPVLARVCPRTGPLERLPAHAPCRGLSRWRPGLARVFSWRRQRRRLEPTSRRALSPLGSNASGSAVAAFSTAPMSLTLAVPSVGQAMRSRPTTLPLARAPEPFRGDGSGGVSSPLHAARSLPWAPTPQVLRSQLIQACQ